MLESTLNDDVDLLPLVTPASASTPAPTSAYLRQAKPSDIPALAAVYARAFARDPLMNWFGGVRALVPTDYDHDQYNRNDGNDNDKDNTRAAAARRTMKGLWDFQLMLVKMGLILGLVVVVVERCGDEREPGIKVGEGEKERIVGGAMWLRPGTSIDPSSFRRVRISPWRSLWSWGFRGFKVCYCVPWVVIVGVVVVTGADVLVVCGQRMGIDYSPRVEKIMDKEFAARGLKRLDSWHLLEIAVDPTCEGKGADPPLCHTCRRKAISIWLWSRFGCRVLLLARTRRAQAGDGKAGAPGSLYSAV